MLSWKYLLFCMQEFKIYVNHCRINYNDTTESKLCDHEVHVLNPLCMNRAAFHGINSSGIDIGVAENIRQPAQILFQSIIGSGEKMAQVVWEYLAWFHAGALAKGLHVPPDIGAVKGLARFCDKDRPGDLLVLFCVLHQRPPKLFGQKNGARLALAIYHRTPRVQRFYGDEF